MAEDELVVANLAGQFWQEYAQSEGLAVSRPLVPRCVWRQWRIRRLTWSANSERVEAADYKIS